MFSSGTPKAWQLRLARHLPTIVLTEPWALFIKGLCIISGLTTFVGPAPGSIQAQLPQLVVTLWSITLVGGALTSLIGLFKTTLWRLEISGLIWLGTAALVYAACIATRFRVDGAVATGIIVGFGLAALFRALGVYVTYEVARQAAIQESM